MGVKGTAAAALEAIAQQGGTTKLNEPVIGTPGTGVPRTGAGPHEGERTAAAPAPKADEIQVTLLEDEEIDGALEEIEGRLKGDATGEQPVTGGEGEQPPEGASGAAEEEPAPGAEGQPAAGATLVVLPAVRDGQEPLHVEIENPEVAERLQAVARAGLRRQEFNRLQAELEQEREERAQFEDALQADPVALVLERMNPAKRLEMARALFYTPEIFKALSEEMQGLEPAELENRSLTMRNQILARRGEVDRTLAQRSSYRQRGREIRGAITRLIPDELDAEEAKVLAVDLERDITDHIIRTKATNLRTEDIPTIVERRLALYGIDPETAASRLQDPDLAPLPLAARRGATRPSTPARTAPARTGQDVVRQAERRRVAGAVPGGGAAIPAGSTVVLPKKQGIKGRIDAMRQAFLGR